MAILARWPLLSDALWYDEVFTLTIASASPHAAFGAILGDVHPPLFYLITRLTPGAVRWPALAFGLLALWLAWLVFTDLARPKVGILAWGLLVLSPTAIYYSAEARMYSLLLALVLLATLATLKQRPWLFGLAVALGLLTHNLFCLYIPGLMLLQRQTHWRWLETAQGYGLASTLYAPWAWFAWRQLGAVQGQGYWLNYYGPGHSLLDVLQVISGQWLTTWPLVIGGFLSLVLLGLGTLAAIQCRNWPILGLAWGPGLMAWLISWLFIPIMMPRVLIGALPFLLLLVVWGYQRLEAIAGRWAWSLAVVPLVCWLSVYQPIRPDYATLFASLAISPGQICAHLTPGSLLLARHYTPQCRHVLWPDWQRRPNGLSPATVAALDFPHGPLDGADWLFYTTSPFSTPQELAYLAGLPAGSASSMVEGGFYHHQVWRLRE